MGTSSLSLDGLDITDCQLDAQLPQVKPTYDFYLESTFPDQQIFALFLAKLGNPNGPMSMSLDRDGDPDALWMWDYLLRIKDTIVWITRSWLNIEVLCWGPAIKKEQFKAFLMLSAKRHRSAVNKAIRELEKYYIFLNPYFKHRKLLSIAEEEYKKITIKEVFYPKNIRCTKKDIRRYKESLQEHHLASWRKAFFASAIILESACIAESYLFLLIAVLRKDALFQDVVAFEKYLRMNWRDKVQLLKQNCDHINQEADLTHPSIRNAEKLFGARNQIMHSYPDKNELEIKVINFHHRRPILPVCDVYERVQSGIIYKLPKEVIVNKSREYAEGFIDYLTSLLSVTAKASIESLAKSNPLGWNETNKKFSIPFANYTASALFPND